MANDARQDLSEVVNKRFKFFHVASLLRQSSNNLTRLVQAYTVMKDPRYERFYEMVIAIRNGQLPRPQNYSSIYWDLVIAENQTPPPPNQSLSAYFSQLKKPYPDGKNMSLKDMMLQVGFTSIELNKLNQALRESNTLATRERKAIALIQ
jgi:methyl-accepting chemotaxis protein